MKSKKTRAQAYFGKKRAHFSHRFKAFFSNDRNKKKMIRSIRIAFLLLPGLLLGQTPPEKTINRQTQSWISLNTNFKVATHWAVLADFHIRRNDFVSEDSFYLVRAGVGYLTNAKVQLVLGYAHLWLAPSKPEWNTFAGENRVYQQLQWNTKIGSVALVQRIRNEQRWQDKITNDAKSGIRFSGRLRYLLSGTLPVFKKKTWPALVVSDEILINFGNQIVYNTFDQNRFFVGIKQQISPELSYDLGYMNVWQQKSSGFQYDSNQTLRLFFYWTKAKK